MMLNKKKACHCYGDTPSSYLYTDQCFLNFSIRLVMVVTASICELLALHKPNILIPLSRNASRGDQILNANSFQKQGFSYVIEEEELTDQTLSEAIQTVWTKRADYIHAMESSDQMDAVTTITNLIEKLRKH